MPCASSDLASRNLLSFRATILYLFPPSLSGKWVLAPHFLYWLHSGPFTSFHVFFFCISFVVTNLGFACFARIRPLIFASVVHYNSVIMNNSVRPKALIIGHSFVRRLKDDLLRNFDSRTSLDFGLDRNMEVFVAWRRRASRYSTSPHYFPESSRSVAGCCAFGNRHERFGFYFTRNCGLRHSWYCGIFTFLFRYTNDGCLFSDTS